MAQPYLQQLYGVHAQPVWEEDVKHTFTDGAAHLVDDQPFHDAPPHTMADSSLHRHPSAVKLEDEFHTPHMWHDRPHSPSFHARHYSIPNAPPMNAHPDHMAKMYGPPYAHHFAHPPTWPMPSASGSSTPTPLYGPVVESAPVSFNSTTGMFPYQQKAHRSVAMSPQSSQGGWASATSDDSGGQHVGNDSPKMRPMSPMTVQRSDGIRKKNARFEIPNHINLQTVEKLILEETNEEVKKELKQQKRLLRNRQAALDSRSRKRNEMDNLTKEKAVWQEKHKEFTDEITRLQSLIDYEREQMMQQRQQYDTFIQRLTFERDEAIRLRTIETTETRRQNNVLKDCIRDLERRHAAHGFAASASETFGNDDYPSFGNLDLDDDTWENEFSIINNDDLKMENEDSPHTPRPLPIPQKPEPSLAMTVSSNKTDPGFSWNTFYICLLFGAYIASQQNSNSAQATAATSREVTAPDNIVLPSLSDEYRAEANNVLKAVLDNDAAGPLLPSSLASSTQPTESNHSHPLRSSQPKLSRLDVLSNQLTTPTRQQQAAAAFAMTPEQYEHIVNPEGLPLRPAEQVSAINEADVAPKPTPLQAMFATMQAERDEVERAVGLGKARERSVMLDRVPEKVLQDFRRLVAEREGRAADA